MWKMLQITFTLESIDVCGIYPEIKIIIWDELNVFKISVGVRI